ncbi:MAG TPA: acyl-[ACP]--phospholipid O-acyltransferase [Candidatus Bathyarchaeia archaeon]|nr:acyl-[ACP]--phospholipid O-acyltransferase [Candidatus Bathyarchaeia archaeon]
METKTCRSASFKAFMATQFLGAFNDNAFKIIISLFALRVFSDPAVHAKFMSIISALFIVPFIVFSPYAGQLADRFPKRNIIVVMKAWEIVIMILGLFSFLSGQLFWMCAVLFLMTAQSAFFSPAKYGIMPEMLDEKELSKGNGFLNMFTFMAIILGTATAGQIMSRLGGNIFATSPFLIGIAVLGFVTSLLIRKTEVVLNQERFEANFAKNLKYYFSRIRQDQALFLALLGIGYFWFLGSVFQMNVLMYGHNVLGLSDARTSLLLVSISIGIGLGSFLAGKLSEGKIEFGIVPVGAIGISVFSLLLGAPALWFGDALIRLFVVGVAAGFYTIPLNAFFQQRSPEEDRGKYLSVLNVTNAFSVLLGAGVMWLLGSYLRFDPRQVFFFLGILSLVGTIYIFKTLPDAFLRFFNWVLTHSIYRVRSIDVDHVPEKGGALIVCNHVSFVDPCLIMASLKRHVRFMMLRTIYEKKWMKPMARIMRGIPVSMDDSPKEIVRSLQVAREAIVNGELVCIFAEGALSKTGNMMPFHRGFEFIMKDLDAPIIPANIDSIWGSIFSFDEGKFFWKWPKQMLHPVRVRFGEPMPASSKSHEVRLAVQELGAESFKLRGNEQVKLHVAFIHEAKKRPFKFCMADSMGMKLNYIQALGSVLMLSRKLFERPNEACGEMVGVLLPSSVMASLVNGACFMAGKIPVNLNFTASAESLASAIRQCEMTRIITSRKFLSKLGMAEDERMMFVEDLNGKISTKDKVFWVLLALVMPEILINMFFVKGNKNHVDDVATVIFSSGSTGEPKGVMLTHSNIFSNVQGFYQVGQVQRDDVVMGVLPFFHSFGFTACLCFPVGTGLSVVYHPNPLDAGIIGKMVEQYKATILIGTPTFFSAYMRKCKPEQFKTLRYAAAGAEKLKEPMVKEFIEKFGVTLFEGYGATELSPIVSMGVPDFIGKDNKLLQIGHKFGHVGHPIPGVAARVVDPDSWQTLGYNQEGLLLIKGANVMRGYLKNPEKTAEVIKDGWYVTGDIATIDQDGFIKITDRLSRFSKIGGEMVPHVKVEEEILLALGTSDPVCVVTALPDEKKGEKLLVLYVGDIDVEGVCNKLAEKGLPNLWIPKKENFFKIESIPMLGSGKTDLKAVKQLAQEFVQGNPHDS